MLGLRLLIILVVTCGFAFAQVISSNAVEDDVPIIGEVTIPYNGVPVTYEIDWDVNPSECQSKMYEWTDGKLKCVGRVVQDSGVPLLEPGLYNAIMEAQRDTHLAGQNMYRLQAVLYTTQSWVDFKNAESIVKVKSQEMAKLQDIAREICKSGNTEYSGPLVGCVKTKTAQGLMAKALSGNKEKE
jgi:hypothetical protein